MTEQTYNRIDLAVEQLEIALCLFLEKRSFVAALTLAGAAEEILGKALSRQGVKNSLEWQFENTEWSQAALYGKPLSMKTFCDNENSARNAAKHIGQMSEQSVTVDIEDASLWMIVRACDNFDRLKLQRTAKMIEFENWFNEQVVGW